MSCVCRLVLSDRKNETAHFDWRTDIYSLAVTIHCVLTGQLPYTRAEELRHADDLEVRACTHANHTRTYSSYMQPTHVHCVLRYASLTAAIRT